MGIVDVIKSGVDEVKAWFSDDPNSGKETPEDKAKKQRAEYQEQFESAARAKTAVEKMWFINIAFTLGYQNSQWNDVSKKFEEPKVPSWRVRSVSNKVLPRYRKALTRLTTYDPGAFATPNSNETLDIEAAQLGTKVLRAAREKVKFRVKNHEKTQWQLLAGTGILHPFWNSDLGEEIKGDESGLAQDNTDNETSVLTGGVTGSTGKFESPNLGSSPSPLKPGKQVLRSGDIDLEVPSPFELFPLDNPGDIRKTRKMDWVKYVDLEVIKQMYPEKGGEVVAEGDNTSFGMYQQKIDSLISTGGGYQSRKNESNDKKALLHRVWERPTTEYQNGRYMAYAGNIILEAGDIPDIELGKEFEMPFFFYEDIGIPGKTWAQSTTEQIIPLNKLLNRSISVQIESGNMMGKPKAAIAKGSLPNTAFTNETGEVLECIGTVPGFFPPHYLPPPSLPNYVTQLPEMLMKSIYDVGAMHEASLAEKPGGGVTSGVAIKELKQSDEMEMNPLFEQDSENKKIIYSMFLKMIQKHYTEGRLLKYVGRDNMPDVISFVGADLRNNTDVWVEMSNIIPDTRVGRQEFIVEFFDKGLLGDKNSDVTRKRAMKWVLEGGTIDEMYADSSEDAKNARYENKDLEKGPDVMAAKQMVKWYHDHATHIMEHKRQMLMPLFLKKQPQVQMAYEEHVKAHDDMMSGISPTNPNANLEAPYPQDGTVPEGTQGLPPMQPQQGMM